MLSSKARVDRKAYKFFYHMVTWVSCPVRGEGPAVVETLRVRALPEGGGDDLLEFLRLYMPQLYEEGKHSEEQGGVNARGR
jgi:hypothetical protein